METIVSNPYKVVRTNMSEMIEVSVINKAIKQQAVAKTQLRRLTFDRVFVMELYIQIKGALVASLYKWSIVSHAVALNGSYGGVGGRPWKEILKLQQRPFCLYNNAYLGAA